MTNLKYRNGRLSTFADFADEQLTSADLFDVIGGVEVDDRMNFSAENIETAEKTEGLFYYKEKALARQFNLGSTVK